MQTVQIDERPVVYLLDLFVFQRYLPDILRGEAYERVPRDPVDGNEAEFHRVPRVIRPVDLETLGVVLVIQERGEGAGLVDAGVDALYGGLVGGAEGYEGEEEGEGEAGQR